MNIETKEAIFKAVIYAATAVSAPLWFPGYMLEQMRDKVVLHYKGKFEQERADRSRK